MSCAPVTGKILLAGGGYADIPMIASLKEMGFRVYTTGNRPDELGHKYADEYIPADFSDPEAVLDICKTLKVDGVCPCCNDFSALSAAYAAEKLNLPGHDSVETLTRLMHKDSFRALARQFDLPVPGWRTIEADAPTLAEPGLKYPLIVKPVDLTGGKGMSVVNRFSELPAAIALAARRSRSSRIVVEEYLEYDDFHHNCVLFISDGRVVFHNSDNEHYYKNKFLVWGMSVPATTPDRIEKQVVEACRLLCSELRLKDGIMIMQYCVHNGELRITECGRRMPGNLHGRLVELATGFDISRQTVKAFLGMPVSGLTQREVRGFWAENCVMADREGQVASFELSDKVKAALVEEIILAGPGFVVEDHLLDKLAILLMRFNSFDEMIETSETMNEHVVINWS